MKATMKQKQEWAITSMLNREGAELEKYAYCQIVRYQLELHGRNWYMLAIWYNNAARPATHYRFREDQQREDYVQKVKKNAREKEEYKAERRRERKEFKTACKVGDIFVSTWGWEQTNVDYYMLVDLTGNTGTFVEIGGHIVEGSMYSHGMACNMMPDETITVREPFKKRILEGETVNLESYKYCKKWDGREDYCSWYA